MGSLGSILRMAGIMQQARRPCFWLLPRALGAQGQRQASFLGGIFGSGEKKAGIATEATFDYHPFKLHQLDEGPATTTSISRDEALRIYREMVTIITSYRAHGFTYVMGVPVLGVLAELTGKKSGVVRGKGGSMHMYAKNFYGGNGIVGAQVPLGAGIAFAHQYKGDGGVNFSLYGDGAANQGQVYEALNLAKLWNLPAVFICENNHYAMGTSQERHHGGESDFFKRGDYIPGIWVDGMDVLAVREATRFAIEYCSVQAKGPLVFEISTYRYHGHSMSDPGTSYRTRDEVQEMRKTRDPITGFRERIIGAELAEMSEIKAIELEVKQSVDADVKKAKSDGEIGEEELYYDIYENNLGGKVRGIFSRDLHEHKKTQQALNV